MEVTFSPSGAGVMSAQVRFVDNARQPTHRGVDRHWHAAGVLGRSGVAGSGDQLVGSVSEAGRDGDEYR